MDAERARNEELDCGVITDGQGRCAEGQVTETDIENYWVMNNYYYYNYNHLKRLAHH